MIYTYHWTIIAYFYRVPLLYLEEKIFFFEIAEKEKGKNKSSTWSLSVRLSFTVSLPLINL